MKVLLVGTGGYATGYVKALISAKKRDFTFEGAVDPYYTLSKAKPLIDEAGIPVYNTMEEFYLHHTADLAVICTPPFLHREQCLTALRHGSYVLCEKPIAPTVKEAEEMLAAEKEYGKFIAIGYQWSYSEAIQALKRDILDGLYGKPIAMKTAISWPRNRAYYARGGGWGGRIEKDGVMILDSIASNACAHYLHNMLFLLGKTMETSVEIASVKGECYRANAIESFDTCTLRLTAEDGTPLYFVASHAAGRKKNPEFLYTFENGEITFSEDEDSIIRARLADGREICYGDPFKSNFKKLWDVMDAIREGRTPICTVQTALPHTRLIGRMYEEIPITDFQKGDIVTLEDTDTVAVTGLFDRMYAAYDRCALLSEIRE